MTPTPERTQTPVLSRSSGGCLGAGVAVLPPKHTATSLSSCGERRFTSVRPTSPASSGVGALYPYPLDVSGFLAAAGRADNAQATTPPTASYNSGYAAGGGFLFEGAA